jgi:hypothetical protein
MLYKNYNTVNTIYLKFEAAITKRDEQIKEEAKKEQQSKLVGFFEGVQIEIPKKEEDNKTTTSEKKENHILLILWVIICIFASFIAILALATVITTYIQNLLAFNKDYCTKLSKVEYNIDDLGIVSRLSNTDNSSKPLTYKYCVKLLFKPEYTQCMKNVSQSKSKSQISKMQIISVLIPLFLYRAIQKL